MRCVFPTVVEETPTHSVGNAPLTVTPVSSSKASTPKSPNPFKSHRFPSPSFKSRNQVHRDVDTAKQKSDKAFHSNPIDVKSRNADNLESTKNHSVPNAQPTSMHSAMDRSKSFSNIKASLYTDPTLDRPKSIANNASSSSRFQNSKSGPVGQNWLGVLTSAAIDEILSKTSYNVQTKNLSSEIAGWPGGLLPNSEGASSTELAKCGRLGEVFTSHSVRIKNKNLILNLLFDWNPTVSIKSSAKVELAASVFEELLFKRNGGEKEYENKETIAESLFSILKSLSASRLPELPAELSLASLYNPSKQEVSKLGSQAVESNAMLNSISNGESHPEVNKNCKDASSLRISCPRGGSGALEADQNGVKPSASQIDITDPMVSGSFLSFAKKKSFSTSQSDFNENTEGVTVKTEVSQLANSAPLSSASSQIPSSSKKGDTRLNGLGALLPPLKKQDSLSAQGFSDTLIQPAKEMKSPSNLESPVERAVSQPVTGTFQASESFVSTPRILTTGTSIPLNSSSAVDTSPVKENNGTNGATGSSSRVSPESADWVIWEAILSGTPESMEKALREYSSTATLPVLKRALKMVTKWKKEKKGKLDDATRGVEHAHRLGDTGKLEKAKANLKRREEDYGKLESLCSLADELLPTVENAAHSRRGKHMSVRDRKKKIQEDIKKAQDEMKSIGVMAVAKPEEPKREAKKDENESLELVKSAWRSLDLEQARMCIANRGKALSHGDCDGAAAVTPEPAASTAKNGERSNASPSNNDDKINTSAIPVEAGNTLDAKSMDSGVSANLSIDVKGKGIMREDSNDDRPSVIATISVSGNVGPRKNVFSEKPKPIVLDKQGSKSQVGRGNNSCNVTAAAVGDGDDDSEIVPCIDDVSKEVKVTSAEKDSKSALTHAHPSPEPEIAEELSPFVPSLLSCDLSQNDLLSYKSFDFDGNSGPIEPSQTDINEVGNGGENITANESTVGDKDSENGNENGMNLCNFTSGSGSGLRSRSRSRSRPRSGWMNCIPPHPPSPDTPQSDAPSLSPKRHFSSSRSLSSTPLRSSTGPVPAASLSASASSLLVSSMGSSKAPLNQKTARSKSGSLLPARVLSSMPSSASSSSAPALEKSSIVSSAVGSSPSTPCSSSLPAIVSSSSSLTTSSSSSMDSKSGPVDSSARRSLAKNSGQLKNGAVQPKSVRLAESAGRNVISNNTSSRMAQPGRINLGRNSTSTVSQNSDLTSDATSAFLQNSRSLSYSSPLLLSHEGILQKNRKELPYLEHHRRPADDTAILCVKALDGPSVGPLQSDKPSKTVNKHNISAPGVVGSTGGSADKKPTAPNGKDDTVDQLCCVCMSGHKKAAFIPCGHTFCRMCAREINKERGRCPLCNRRIRDVLKLY